MRSLVWISLLVTSCLHSYEVRNALARARPDVQVSKLDEARIDLAAVASSESGPGTPAAILCLRFAARVPPGIGQREAEPVVQRYQRGAVSTEERWFQEAWDECIRVCQNVVSTDGFSPGNRDLGTRYLAHCTKERSDYRAVVRDGSARTRMQTAERWAAEGNSLELLESLRTLEERLPEQTADLAAELTARVAALRAQHEASLALAASYLRDPRVVRLKRHYALATNGYEQILEAGEPRPVQLERRLELLEHERGDLASQLGALQREYGL